MTIDEFKKKLVREHTGQFVVLPRGAIRHHAWTGTCPLAVIFGQKRSYVHTALEAGMSIPDQRAIMDAADGHSSELRSWMLENLC